MTTKFLIEFAGYLIVDADNEDEAYGIATATLRDTVDYFQIHNVETPNDY